MRNGHLTFNAGAQCIVLSQRKTDSTLSTPHAQSRLLMGGTDHTAHQVASFQ